MSEKTIFGCTNKVYYIAGAPLRYPKCVFAHLQVQKEVSLATVVA